ncbi:MAG: hypothetical protein SXV54_12390 [Chloroflexota bacterium]|nr:hypothetical protein [Chloroflexota bacterium]
MVEQLAQEYADQPVVFLEYDVDDDSAREWRWWQAFGGGTVILPMVMVDSGNQISNGYEDFYTKYTAMVDASLERDAQAEIIASGQRSDDTLHFEIQITNQSDIALGPSNGATVWAIVYEKFETSGSGRLTNRFVRAAVSVAIPSDLAPDATETFTLDTPVLSGVNWDNLHVILLADYRPGGTSGAYDTLQAVSVPTIP